MKRPNLRIIVVKEKELQLNDVENKFNKMIEENFLKLKDIPMKVQEAYRISNRLTQNKTKMVLSPYYNQNTKHTE